MIASNIQAQLDKISLKKLGIYLVVAVSALAGAYAIVTLAPGGAPLTESLVYEEENNESETILSDKDLFNAINEQRKNFNVFPLQDEASTCALAEARVEEVYEKGVNIFGKSASFQRTIDRVLTEDTSIDPNTIPEYYKEFLTYEETIEDAIGDWSQNELTRALLMEPDYQFGCVAEKNGYAIVIVGYTKTKTKQADDKIYYDKTIYPKGIEKSRSETI